MKTIGLAGVLQNPSTNLNYHNAGWTNLVVKQLDTIGITANVITEKDDWDIYDEIYFLHGVNYKYGVYNLFGGVSDQLISRLKKIDDYKGSISSLFDKFPNISELCEKRSININLTKDYTNIETIDSILNNENIVLGDSHSISVCPSNYNIIRLDGKTLYGALKIGLINLLPKELPKNLIVYFGNIDVRFHLCRQHNPKAVEYLLNDYFHQLFDLKKLGVKNITVVQVLPIEDPSRKIPKTGQYKNKNFFGSLLERSNLVTKFNNLIVVNCEKLGFNTISWPNHYIDDFGKLKFKVMEAKQSVHIRPKYYLS